MSRHPFPQRHPSLSPLYCTPVLQNLVEQYESRGYLFEQYDDRDGKGTSSHPFTGWTALVALIAANAY